MNDKNIFHYLISMKFCDRCNQICKKNTLGTFIFLCKENITLCIDCNSFRFLKKNNNILKFLIKREIYSNKKKQFNNT